MIHMKNRRPIQSISPEGLAAWQVGWKGDTAKWLLAEREWDRRAMVENAKWHRISALLALLGVVVGAALTWIVGILLK